MPIPLPNRSLQAAGNMGNAPLPVKSLPVEKKREGAREARIADCGAESLAPAVPIRVAFQSKPTRWAGCHQGDRHVRGDKRYPGRRRELRRFRLQGWRDAPRHRARPDTVTNPASQSPRVSRSVIFTPSAEALREPTIATGGIARTTALPRTAIKGGALSIICSRCG